MSEQEKREQIKVDVATAKALLEQTVSKSYPQELRVEVDLGELRRMMRGGRDGQDRH